MTLDPAAVPDGWHRVRLGDLGRFVNGRAFKPSDWGQSGLPIVRIQNLTSAEAPFNHYDGEVGDDNLIDTGDIVVSWSASIEARTWDRGPAVLNQHIFKVVARKGVAEQRFLFFLLEAAPSELRRRVHGTTMQHVTKGTFDSTPALLPPLPEQRAIAAVLDGIDEAIERTEEVIAATERVRDALLHELLTRGLPGRHSEWVDVPGLGTVPACWEVVRLGDVAEVQTGRAVNKNASPSEGVEAPYLSVANVKDGYLALDSVKKMLVSPSDLERYGLRAGDVLFTEGGDADKLGRGTVWQGEIEPCIHQNHVFAVRPHAGALLSIFLSAFAATARGRRYFLRAAKQTTNLASMNSTQLKSMPLALPTVQEQRAIIAAIEDVDGSVQRAREERARLQSVQASAADALLTGRVRVAGPEG